MMKGIQYRLMSNSLEISSSNQQKNHSATLHITLAQLLYLSDLVYISFFSNDRNNGHMHNKHKNMKQCIYIYLWSILSEILSSREVNFFETIIISCFVSLTKAFISKFLVVFFITLVIVVFRLRCPGAFLQNYPLFEERV